MPDHPLYIALVWHMHQPYYRDMCTREISLPWVRLHAAKDYLHMAQVLADHPNVHLTINVVPSLWEQMSAWTTGQAQDRLVWLAEQSEWNRDDQRAILNLAYSISWDLIRRYGRYAELLDRRLQALTEPETFTAADYRDLLGWFNLAWTDPNWLERDELLAGLIAKGRGFTIEDLRTIHARQREIATRVLPLYRELADRGQLEISTSPYYHPILPLLIDFDAARQASPGLPLPGLFLTAPEDATAQLQLAVAAHTPAFGSPPQGLWPSEGAVSAELLPAVTAAGFRWLATDEIILGRSLGRPFERDGSGLVTNPRALYRPYRVLTGSEIGPSIIFRDHELSDRIGFLYRHLPGQQAAEDLIYRLLEIRNRLNDPSTPYLVSIILDGENCWEYYEHNGDVFLHALYDQLGRRRELKTVTVSEYLAQHPAGGTLARLATGSWIGGDLTTWIGDPEHNRAWEALVRTRAHLIEAANVQPDSRRLREAWQALYTAEGSDWFWWYSHRNRSDQNALFDRLFRHDLAGVYEALGDEVPAWLEHPIGQAPAGPEGRAAAGYCAPQLDGAPYPGPAWALAAVLQPASTGTMQPADAVIERLLVGHDRRSLYLRLELRDHLERYETAIYLGGMPGLSVNQRPRDRLPGLPQAASGLMLNWEVRRLPGQPAPFLSQADGHDQWLSVGPVASALGEKVLEIALPFQAVGLEVGQEVSLLVTLAQRGAVVAQLPERSMGTFTLQRFELVLPHDKILP